MKFTQTITACILISALAIGGCKKDKDNDDAVGGSGTLTASSYGFDGSNSGKFSSTAAGIVKASAGGASVLTITGIKDGSKELITIVILKDVTTTGKIQFGSQYANGGITLSKDYTKPADLSLNYSTDNNGTTMAGGGEVNITKIDGNNIEGTFYAIAYNNNQKEAFAEQGAFKGTINK